MVDATGTIESRRMTDTYVDDSDNWATAPESQTAEEGVRTLQHHAQMWAVLVAVTEQLLAFHKCSWQLIVWLAVNGYYIMASRTNFDNENVILTDHNGMESTIEYKSHREHNKGLGFSMCPDANQDPEFKHRLEQAKFCAKQMFNVFLPVSVVWVALVTRVLPKVTYCFGLMRFNKKQLKKIAIAIDNAFLPRLGINRKMKRIAVYAPLELGGINYPSIETIQDQKGITLLLRQLQWWDKDIALDLRILISQAQLEAGTLERVLDPIRE
jgi:hypothetical protein